ncbi:hypothetical protein Pmar_PMAR015841 [Perkinsus marinus ATCC 50983]|uniref:Uncharacterized protein n=1 Tax=Perkinsus marinus (strain ATCC 50983 / TXsc) TaxID=423536 RepID=C5K892_PERM5|nr:hypothetical protein Pmar_PMAR015841 [Perkinsus marinus ATCC 50983]EER19280.1 hypothetical protein Pmar_PMAR015841 [Perkinsus marinus ATCC 50983]|eukprot:XP_002787484.1 hypothetical protein Pmar_PMAR015841 [Perkinsus marinus ATCC 50983]
MAEESPTVPHLAELDIPEHFLPVDPLKDPCHRQPANDGEVWCYRRSLVVELSTLLDLDEDVVVDMTVLRDRISQCERWEKTLNDVLALELSKRRDLLRRGNDIIEAASREVCLALVATVNSRRALRSLVERKVYSPTRTLALARRRHRLILVKERIMDVARMSRAYKAYRSASTVIESIHAAIRLQQLLTAGIELPCWMKKAGHDWTHPSELLADTKSTLYERLKPLAVVDDLSSLQKAYVETLSGYWQLIISYTDVGSADINPAADMCSIFCNLVGTIARQCLLAATNFGGRVMDEIAYTGRKTMPASELCQLLDPREFPHFLHRLLEVFLTLIIRYDRLVTWHDSFKGCDVMTDDDPHLIEFINNLSAELTARRDMVLDRVNNQLQSLLEPFDSVTGCPLSIASNVCGLLRVFSHATMNGSGTTGALEQVISRLGQSIIRDVSLRVWDADLLPLAQRESWNLLESSDPLIPSPRRLRGSITGGVEGLEALSKPSIEAAIYDPDLGGVSSMVSPRWPLLTQATANRMGELLQLGVVHPSILGLFVVRHPTFDDVVNGGHHSRGDMKDRHAIYEGHDKHIANTHYRTLSPCLPSLLFQRRYTQSTMFQVAPTGISKWTTIRALAPCRGPSFAEVDGVYFIHYGITWRILRSLRKCKRGRAPSQGVTKQFIETIREQCDGQPSKGKLVPQAGGADRDLQMPGEVDTRREGRSYESEWSEIASKEKYSKEVASLQIEVEKWRDRAFDAARQKQQLLDRVARLEAQLKAKEVNEAKLTATPRVGPPERKDDEYERLWRDSKFVDADKPLTGGPANELISSPLPPPEGHMGGSGVFCSHPSIMYPSINAFKLMLIGLMESITTLLVAIFRAIRGIEPKASSALQPEPPVGDSTPMEQVVEARDKASQPRERKERIKRCIYCGHRVKRGDHSRCRPLTREERLQIEPKVKGIYHA